ncbi:MAG: hypothetical protein V4565_05245 [Bacteroidota bacterium]
MFRFRTYSFVYFVILFSNCKKNVPQNIIQISCGSVYSQISSDTNYIPHKKNNRWDYCCEYNSSIGWTAKVLSDTVIGKNKFFEIEFVKSQNRGNSSSDGNESGKSMIDSLGNYYWLKSRYIINTTILVFDSIMIIKPSAISGDTIYSDALANTKVVLVNKNETFNSIQGCYHSRIIRNSNLANQEVVDHYYKKGIGEIYFSKDIKPRIGCVLNSALIN